MTSVIDKQGREWTIDEGLRKRAKALQDIFPEQIDYVDLSMVIFLKVFNSKEKWHGKCFYIGATPHSIISKFIVLKMREFGLLDLANVSSADGDIFDIRYIIVLNDVSLSRAVGDIQRVEDITLLHELMHIKPTFDGLIKHDLEDFKLLVDTFGAHWAEGIFKDNDEEKGSVNESFIPFSMTEAWAPQESD